MQNNKRQISGYLLTILFVFYFASANFFGHVHVDENNHLIVHSHPFSSEANHHHTSATFHLIDKLSCFVFGLIVLGLSILALYEFGVFLNAKREKYFRPTAFLSAHFSRPPPHC